jgi:hypothetical protein
MTQQLGSDNLLAVGRVLKVGYGFEERSNGGPEPRAARDVNGVWFETVLKCRSQMACGSSDRRARHGFLICAKKSSCLIPVADLAEAKEG